MSITDKERAVLGAINISYGEFYHPFATISAHTGLDRTEVRSVCRALAKNGLAMFSSGLWNFETDQPAGSGYGITAAGRRAYYAAHANRWR